MDSLYKNKDKMNSNDKNWLTQETLIFGYLNINHYILILHALPLILLKSLSFSDVCSTPPHHSETCVPSENTNHQLYLEKCI